MAKGLYRTSKKPKGSWEGHMGGNTTRLQMNGSGYDATQKARDLRPSRKMAPSTPTAYSPSRSSGGSVHDYRRGKNDSASQILNNRMKLGKII
jgi:hypothetical protein